ncbi:unnamed protein product [Oreochromis niloticus]|nr:unnamed protein product [Mustela putorius furo]
MTCNRKADLQQLSRFSTFNHLKIEVRNNWINKRKLYYSSPDEGYVSPLKKPLSPKALSPDLECFTDHYSPFVGQQSASSYPEPLPKKQNVGSAVNQPVNSRLHCEHIKQCGSSTDPGGEEIVQKHITSENILFNFSPVFDYDLDAVCYLSPINTCTAAGNLDPAESCTAPHCNTFPEKQFPAVQHLEEMERRVGRESLRVSDDRGYVSLSSINDHKGDGLLNSKQLTGNSNPRLRVVENGCHPQRSPKPQHKKQTVTSGSFTVAVDDLSPAVSGPYVEPVTSVESLESETEGVWDIGPPMLESSPYGTVRPNTAGDRSLASESSGCSTEDTNLEDTWKNILPLQVQVKSKVVVPCQQTTKPEEESRARTAKCSGTQRPVIFGRRSDWEKKKRLYVHSVIRHMQEKQGAHNGVMSELLSVMNRVAGERAGKDGKRWQHPSDFTRRNYQSRFGTKPEMTLREWQRKNYGSHERFSKVPKQFERCHCPRV